VVRASPVGTNPAALVGEWALERRVSDRRLRRHGRVDGVLSVASDGDGFSWTEHGTLCWDGRTLAVTRTLGVHRLDGSWWMTFSDGRPFHPWQPGRAVIHPCAADTYAGVVDVDASGDVLRVLWVVTGPAKDQRIFSRCRRVA
jgi:hypothetical protein